MYGIDQKQAILFKKKQKHSDGMATDNIFFGFLGGGGDGIKIPPPSETEFPSLIPSPPPAPPLPRQKKVRRTFCR